MRLTITTSFENDLTADFDSEFRVERAWVGNRRLRLVPEMEDAVWKRFKDELWRFDLPAATYAEAYPEYERDY